MVSEPFSKQILTVFNRLSTVQKLSLGGAVVALATVGFFVIRAATATPFATLYSNLEPKDASAIIAKLDERGIKHELKDNGATVAIPSDLVHETRIQLAGEGLPESSTVGYELFDKMNLGMSDFQQKLNFKRATEGELARTIGALQEVSKARVHLVMPETRLFEKDQKKPTASVFLTLKGGRSINKLNINSIQELVSKSVEGLDAGSVTVIDQRGQILSDPIQDKNSLAGMSSTQYDQQQKVDNYLSQKVQSMLDGVIGPANSNVRVNAELDFTQVEKTVTEVDPDKQAILSEEIKTDKSKNGDSTVTTSSQAERGNTVRNYENTKKVERIVNAVGTIKRLTVSAFINGESKIIDDKNGEPKIEYTPRSADEIKKFTTIIQNTVGYDPTRNDEVSVLNVPFDNPMLDDELLDRKKIIDVPISMQELIEKILLGLAAVTALVMLKKLFGSQQVKKKFELGLGIPREVRFADGGEVTLGAVPGQQGHGALSAGSQFGRGNQHRLDGSEQEDEEEEEDLSLLTEEDRYKRIVERARRILDDAERGEMTEQLAMQHEIRQRVSAYVQERPELAARLVRVWMQEHNN